MVKVMVMVMVKVMVKVRVLVKVRVRVRVRVMVRVLVKVRVRVRVMVRVLVRVISKDKAPRDAFLEIIQEWKWYWMNQTQNSEADYLNYQRRAHGIDANMEYDLADRLAAREDALEAKLAECVAALEFYGDKDNWDLDNMSPTIWNDGNIDLGNCASETLSKVKNG